MSKEQKSSFPYDNPFRFDKIDDYIYDRYNSIRSRKKRIVEEMKQAKKSK